MKQLYFLLFLSLLMNSCSNTSESSKGQAAVPLSVQAISFENEQVLENDKFHVKYPGSWKPGTAGKAKTEFVLNAPLIPNGDLSKESVHLMKRDLAGKTVAEFIKMTLDQYQKEIYEFEILGSANNEFTFLGGPLENKAKYRHRFIEKDGVIYILGYSAGLKDWSTYEITADKIMRTFYLK
ncbi:MAG: hypothetical protein ACI9VN_000491 [Patescibacteria group bacterium]|jgi:hypothetical protein